MPELVFLHHGEERLRVALNRSRLVLGRAETSDIVIPDVGVSQHQAAVLFEGGAAVVEDLSGTGTVVSGGKTDRAPLPDGADITLGQWRAVFRAESSAEEAAAARALHAAPNPQRWSTRGPFVGMVRVFSTAVPTLATSISVVAPLAQVPAPGTQRGPASEALIGADPGIRLLANVIDKVALSTDLAAIFGEPGTGRELVARAIHARTGPSERPLVRVQCRRVHHELLELELFGRETGASAGPGGTRRGAFEEAAGGTLFLDEVGALSLELQEALLGVLESRQFRRVGATIPSPVNVRLVVATNKDLLSATRVGTFREDLYNRLCVAPLILPPLRRRRGDVPALAEHLVRVFSPRGQPVSITPDALALLAQYSWPGNIRELRNVVHRALLLRNGPTIDVGELRFDPEPARTRLLGQFVPGQTLDQMLRAREREIVESALLHFDNNRERVARELGVARSTLFKRLKDWGLTKHEDPEPEPEPALKS
jgi:two-component system, NtrC family, response regulator HydG